MSSGRKGMRQNTRERILSTDFNRMQAFAAGWSNEALRRQMLAPQDDSLYVGTTFQNAGPLSAAFDVLTPAAPDAAGVMNGLMVVVPGGATYVLVTSGMMLVVDPEGAAGSSDPSALNPDDGPGPARLVYSAGVTVAGSLSWTANPGPGTRVDVVECQRVNLVSETDNRDIFDPSTGLFTPASVTKVTVGDLTYRIRQGVPGGGLPPPALGWVPLAVIASAAGAANLDAATVWDVRPLLSDLATPYAQVRSIYPEVTRYQMVAEDKSVPGSLLLSGESQGEYLGWRTGGIFAEPDVGPAIDLLNAPFYQAAGFAPVASAPYYVYALWPAGYVRWVRYYPTAVAGVGGRVPGPFRGIVAVSQTPPLNGQPILPVATPSAWGLGVSTIFGQMLAAGVVGTGGALNGFVADGLLVNHDDTLLPSITPFSITVVSPSEENVTFVLVPGLHFPAGSRRVRISSQSLISFPVAGTQVVMQTRTRLIDGAAAEIAYVSRRSSALVRGDVSAVVAYLEEWDVPVAADGISAPPPLGLEFVLSREIVNAGAPGTLFSTQLQVVGWDL